MLIQDRCCREHRGRIIQDMRAHITVASSTGIREARSAWSSRARIMGATDEADRGAGSQEPGDGLPLAERDETRARRAERIAAGSETAVLRWQLSLRRARKL